MIEISKTSHSHWQLLLLGTDRHLPIVAPFPVEPTDAIVYLVCFDQFVCKTSTLPHEPRQREGTLSRSQLGHAQRKLILTVLLERCLYCSTVSCQDHSDHVCRNRYVRAKTVTQGNIRNSYFTLVDTCSVSAVPEIESKRFPQNRILRCREDLKHLLQLP